MFESFFPLSIKDLASRSWVVTGRRTAIIRVNEHGQFAVPWDLPDGTIGFVRCRFVPSMSKGICFEAYGDTPESTKGMGTQGSRGKNNTVVFKMGEANMMIFTPLADYDNPKMPPLPDDCIITPYIDPAVEAIQAHARKIAAEQKKKLEKQQNVQGDPEKAA
jgi:hypothetical protein